MTQDMAACPVWDGVRVLRSGDPGCDPAVELGVALLVLDASPHSLITRRVLAGLREAVRYLAADESLRAVVLTGSGDGPFSRGADLTELAAMDALDATAWALAGQAAATALAALPVPVIAAIGGDCLAEGLELALACDLRVAAADAILGLPGVAAGLPPGWGATQRLARLIGPARAKELIFTGARLRAERAHAIGLVDRVTQPGGHLPAALDLAAAMTAAGSGVQPAIAAAKDAIDQGLDLKLAEGLRLEAALFGELFGGLGSGDGNPAADDAAGDQAVGDQAAGDRAARGAGLRDRLTKSNRTS